MTDASRHLDPAEAWDEIHKNAMTSMLDDKIHTSAKFGKEYAILEVGRLKLAVERTGRDGRKQKKPFTRNTALKMIKVLNDNPGGSTPADVLQDRDYYLLNLLIDLHSRVQLRSGQVSIIPCGTI